MQIKRQMPLPVRNVAIATPGEIYTDPKDKKLL